MPTEIDANPKKSRTRSPAYPYLDLRSALDKAAVLWKAEGRHAAAINVVMHHWGYKDESSTGYSCMAALKKFGLIEHDGIGENKQIRLSLLAQAILLDENPDSPARAEALRTAALSPRIHAELWERYGSELPSDQSLKRYLVLEKSFNESVVDELVAEYKQTIFFAGLNLVPAPASAVGGNFGFAAQPAAVMTPMPQQAAVASGAPRGGYAPQPTVEELSYEDRERERREPVLPPPRAIGPANGAVRREVDPYDLPAPRAAEPMEPRRRPQGAAGYPQDARRAAERERARYDQESFGYEEEYLPLPTPPNARGNESRSGSANSGGYQPQPVATLPTTLPMQLAGNGGGNSFSQGAPAIMHGSATDLETVNGAPRKELPVPLDGDRVALVPYPMTEEDFTLLIATLNLGKKRLVRSGRE